VESLLAVPVALMPSPGPWCWMLAEGFWSRERRRRRHRRRNVRPERSALRAPQGFAPGKANDKDKNKNQKKNQNKKGTLLMR